MTPPTVPPTRPPSNGLTLAIAGAAFGLLMGFVAGGVGPRRALSQAEAENSHLKDELVKANSKAGRREGFSGGLLGGIGGMFGEPAPDEAPGDPAAAGPPGSPAPGPGGPTTAEVPGTPPEAAERDASPEADLAAFDQAAELQAVRAAQTRAAIIEQAELNPEEQERMDGIVSSLEERLAEHAEAVAVIIATGEEPSTAEALRLTHEISGALFEAQSGMEALLGPERLENLDEEAIPVWNMIEIDGMHAPLAQALEAQTLEAQP
jgi:hypothetical protein